MSKENQNEEMKSNAEKAAENRRRERIERIVQEVIREMKGVGNGTN